VIGFGKRWGERDSRGGLTKKSRGLFCFCSGYGRVITDSTERLGEWKYRNIQWSFGRGPIFLDFIPANLFHVGITDSGFLFLDFDLPE